VSSIVHTETSSRIHKYVKDPVARLEASPSGAIMFAVLLGVCVAFVYVPLLGISSAIAAPKDLFPWAKANGVLEPALLAWYTLVIGGLGMALPVLAAMVVGGVCLWQWRRSPAGS